MAVSEQCIMVESGNGKAVSLGGVGIIFIRCCVFR